MLETCTDDDHNNDDDDDDDDDDGDQVEGNTDLYPDFNEN